ncbi:MAG: J domain-containing protein, partial [Bradyrhizobium sp.]
NAEERARKALGLPLGRPLVCAEIHRAFRRAAKSMHPDAGGSEQAFRELIAAQDVLLHPGNHKGE